MLGNEEIEEIKRGLIKIDNEIRIATIFSDQEKLENWISDDFVYAHSGAAKFDTKESWIETVCQTKGLYLSRNYIDVTVKLYGETAVLSGFVVDTYNTNKYEGASPCAYYHQLRIYQLQAGSWRLANQHTTCAVDTVAHSYEVLGIFYEKYWSRMDFDGRKGERA